MEKTLINKIKFLEKVYKENHQNDVSNLLEHILFKLNKTELSDKGYVRMIEYINAITLAMPIKNTINNYSWNNLCNYFINSKIIDKLLSKYQIFTSKQIKEEYQNNNETINLLGEYQYALIKENEIVLLFTSFTDVFSYLYKKEYRWINNRYIDSLNKG